MTFMKFRTKRSLRREVAAQNDKLSEMHRKLFDLRGKMITLQREYDHAIASRTKVSCEEFGAIEIIEISASISDLKDAPPYIKADVATRLCEDILREAGW